MVLFDIGAALPLLILGMLSRETLLRWLRRDGPVVAEGQRGFEVAPVSPEALKVIAALRQLLECHTMELSFAAGDMDWEGRVVSAHHKLHQMEIRMISTSG